MGWKRQWKASISTRPVRSAAATMERACAVLDAKGFSHRTWWPASERGDRPLLVQVVYEGVVNSVERTVRDEFFIAPVGSRDAVGTGEGLGACRVRRCDRGDVDDRHLPGWVDHGARGDPGRAEDPYPHRLVALRKIPLPQGYGRMKGL